MQSVRPPIVVILGHVDHGKTTLLDYLRKSNVAARESGGITQHIRSFQLELPGSTSVTFIDTPGHQAFSEMRHRGSRVADIAVLVVAADDGVMPQTRQSISFIKESGLSFIVALNKIDVPSADPDRVLTQLAEDGVLVESFGGGVPAVKISAKTGQGVPDLLEIITLINSLNPAMADSDADLEATVLESRMDSKKGPLATLIIKNGSLHTGQEVFQTNSIGKARAIIDSDGKTVSVALPSQPVEILGLAHVIEVGSQISNHPLQSSVNLANAPRSSGGSVRGSKLNLIIKADVAGSLEAILAGLPSDVTIVSSGTGDISENDIMLARTSGSEVLGFNVRTPSGVAKLAESEKVSISTFRIIYELFDYLDKKLHPVSTEQILGKAKVLADFKIESEKIAGCKCTEGAIEKGSFIRVERAGQLIGKTKIRSLRQGKTIVERVKIGTEFGAVFSPFVDFKIGDDIIATTG